MTCTPTEEFHKNSIGLALFPYRFYGQGSYFGELECILGKGRVSTVRCENVDGSNGEVLILKKRDFSELVNEFPQFGEAWGSAAWRREAMRLASLKELTVRRTCRHAAASRIQQGYREYRYKPDKTLFHGSDEEDVMCHADSLTIMPNIVQRVSGVGIMAHRA
eukprot:CAMPEP_0172836844 /NCGR_PEP_ID=MMETSP1075-20121228/26770_1 /TAXON_ID=2916 /ORGANISM="Ceratium fusus, Strain PA161109" /LENGTH=162 /DNA_ID=CAMNT_0013680137 /DNA_START=34 /DNA_END=519 /DNA_ORIENTATION=+